MYWNMLVTFPCDVDYSYLVGELPGLPMISSLNPPFHARFPRIPIAEMSELKARAPDTNWDNSRRGDVSVPIFHGDFCNKPGGFFEIPTKKMGDFCGGISPRLGKDLYDITNKMKHITENLSL